HEQGYASLIDASSKNTDLLQFENHLPRLNIALCVIDVSRAWYVHASLKQCRKQKCCASHVLDSAKMKNALCSMERWVGPEAPTQRARLSGVSGTHRMTPSLAAPAPSGN
ncbi:MAG: hypothetical protein WBM28_15575, partial [Burkholderiales bacterium]